MGEVEVLRPNAESKFTTGRMSSRETGRQRIAQLAIPKTNKAVWATTEPYIKYGNQELMRPLTHSAINAACTERVESLATPKKDFQANESRPDFVYSCGRSSPIERVSQPAMNASASERVTQLAEPKNLTADHHEDRLAYTLDCGTSDPIWGVSSAAMNAEDRERTMQLAQPKAAHRDFVMPKPVQWHVADSARYGTFPNMDSLAKPKERDDKGLRHPEWTVSKAAMQTTSSSRILELSRHKKQVEAYRPDREVQWKIPSSVLRGSATQRLRDLAMPIVRDTMDHVQFDPLAFQVKQTALKGKIRPRINELSEPVLRPGPVGSGKK